MKNYNKLIKNTGIFTIANFGSKILTVLLVPFYTHVLTTEQFGRVDIITNTISLILPIISLSIFEAILRFTMDVEDDEKEVFSSGMLVVVLGIIVSLILMYFINFIPIFNNYAVYIFLILNFQSINTAFSQFVRAIGKVRLFAFNGMLNTFILLISNVILLGNFRMGIEGYLISIILANFLCSIHVFIRAKIWRYFSLKAYDFNLIKRMLKYSIPLIPNSIMWWIMNLLDRYVIMFSLGLNYNGIYAVANKIPSFLKVFHSIFAQAWQLSAIEEVNSKDKEKFYSTVFNTYSACLFIVISAIIVPIKFLITYLFDSSYSEAWTSIPFLLLAVMFSSFSSFLGTNYIAMKKTNGVFKTSMVGAIINLIFNFLLIGKLKLVGAAIATMLSFLVVWILRIKDTKSFINIHIDKIRMFLSFCIIIIQIILLFLNIRLEIFVQLCLMMILIITNLKYFYQFVLKLKK